MDVDERQQKEVSSRGRPCHPTEPSTCGAVADCVVLSHCGTLQPFCATIFNILKDMNDHAM